MICHYLVHDALEAEGLRDLDGRHGVPHVHLVGEEEDRDLARTDVGVLNVQLIYRYSYQNAMLTLYVESLHQFQIVIYVYLNFGKNSTQSTSLQQHVELVLGDHHPQFVAGVHHEDDALALLRAAGLMFQYTNRVKRCGTSCVNTQHNTHSTYLAIPLRT